MNTRQLRTLTATEDFLTAFNRETIGFERMFEHFNPSTWPTGSNYPVYNLLKTDENEYMLEVAVAGFVRDDLTITVDGGILVVVGKKSDKDLHKDYLYRGIAERSFSRNFPMAEHIEVKGADLKDGILQIILVKDIPEALKIKTIEIK